MTGDAAEHIAKPGERIDFVEFATGDKAAQDGHGFPAAITAQESPVVSAYGNTAQRTFCTIVVNGQIAIVQIARDRYSVLHVGRNCLAGVALGQQLLPDLQQVSMYLTSNRAGSLLPQQAQ